MDFVSSQKTADRYDLENVIKGYRDGTIKGGDTVSVKCFVYNVRVKKNFSFVIVRDGRRIFQCFFSPEECAFDIDTLREESAVLLTGKIVADSPCKINPGFEIAVTDIQILSEPPEALPLAIYKSLDQLNWSDDTLFDYRALTLRNQYYRSILRITEGVLTAFRNFMRSEDFTEFVPPKIVEAGAEGGADMFNVDYFGKPAFLTQSPQMYKQLMVGVFCKAFCVSPVFRAEKHSTSRHINEFEGLDLEMGFIDSFADLMALEARMMKYVFDFLRENYADELKELKAELPVVGDIPQIEFTAVKELIQKEYNRPYRDENDLEPEEERLIGRYFKEKYNSEFVFITHYPSVKRPFYAMDDPGRPGYTLSFDLLLNGAEITTGGQRIHDYNEQVAKMQKRGMKIEQFSEYLAMHRCGMPPHGGMGIGLERLVMRILKLDNIKYATAFPRDRDRLKP